MSVEDNKQLVRRLVEDVLNTGRTDLLSEFFKPGSLLAGSFKQNIEINRAAFPDARSTIDNIVAEDDQVVVVLNTQGTNTQEILGQPATGKSAVWTSFHLYKIKDGRITSAVFCSDRLGIRQQLGLLPDTA
jgi:predicted ester cyclase